jgi:6-phosphogluconolactonase (cycloisomerase 2 family)
LHLLPAQIKVATVDSLEENIMKSNATPVESVSNMPECCANGRRIHGHGLQSHAQLEHQFHSGYRGSPTASRISLIVIAALLPISLAGCSAGSMGSSETTASLNVVSQISSVAPASANAGAGALTITVSGDGFVSNSTVIWNGTSLTTTGSDTQLTATIPAADLTKAGAAQITVFNPAPGGGTSNPVGFVIKGTEAAAIPGFVYVANTNDATVSAYLIDTGNGSLSSIAGSPFPIPGAPAGGGVALVSAAADPSTPFLYLASDASNLSSANDLPAMAINSSTGVLTPVSGSPFNTGQYVAPEALTTDATGKFLYVADEDGNNPSGNNISEFDIDAATGALTPLAQAACLAPYGYTTGIAADPVEPFLYVSNSDGAVCAFTISSQGILQAVAGSPFALPYTIFQNNATSVVVDPLGKFVYVAANSVSSPSSVWAFSIAQGVGSLTQVAGSPFATGGFLGDNALSLAMDQLGRFLYVGNGFDISGFSINTSTGSLSMLAGFPFSQSPLSPAYPVVDPSGQFLYAANAANNTVSAYAINETTGVLTTVPGSPLAAGSEPAGLTVTRKPE